MLTKWTNNLYEKYVCILQVTRYEIMEHVCRKQLKFLEAVHGNAV